LWHLRKYLLIFFVLLLTKSYCTLLDLAVRLTKLYGKLPSVCWQQFRAKSEETYSKADGKVATVSY